MNTPIKNSRSGTVSSYTKEEMDKKFEDAVKRMEKIDWVLLAVVIILLAMFMTLLIDSFHFNSAVYKEYSQKTESVENLNITNKLLLEQSILNQKNIIDLQNKILEIKVKR